MDRIEALKVFVRVVELGSFTAAAKELRLRQATVSRWVAQLEDELSTQLLLRTTRSVSETDAGRAFYQNSKQVIAAWDEAVGSVQEVLIAGRVRMSVPVVFGAQFVAPLVVQFLKQNPAAKVDMIFSDRYVDLANDGFDIAIRVGQPVDSQYRAVTLARSSRRVVASPDFLRTHRVTNPKHLLTTPCLIHSGINNRAVWVFERGGATTKVDVGGSLVVNHSATIFEAAVEGLGVALLASWLVDEAIEDGSLKRVLTGYRLPDAPVQALYSATRYVPTVVRTMLDFLAEELRHDPRLS